MDPLPNLHIPHTHPCMYRAQTCTHGCTYGVCTGGYLPRCVQEGYLPWCTGRRIYPPWCTGRRIYLPREARLYPPREARLYPPRTFLTHQGEPLFPPGRASLPTRESLSGFQDLKMPLGLSGPKDASRAPLYQGCLSGSFIPGMPLGLLFPSFLPGWLFPSFLPGWVIPVLVQRCFL